MPKNNKLKLLGLVGILLLLVGGGLFYHQQQFLRSHFANQTVINNVDVSRLTLTQGRQKLLQQARTRQVIIQEPHHRHYFKYRQPYTFTRSNQQALQDCFQAHDRKNTILPLQYTPTTNQHFQQAVQQYLQHLNQQRAPVQDAQIIYRHSQLQVRPARRTNLIDIPQTVQNLSYTQNQQVLKVVYVQPQITEQSPQFRNLKNNLQHLGQIKVHYLLDHHEENLPLTELIPAAVFQAGKLKFAPTPLQHKLEQLDRKYRTLNTTLHFQNAAGNYQALYNQGSLGWQLDIAAETRYVQQKLQQLLEQQPPQHLVLISAQHIQGNDYNDPQGYRGKDWVEIDLTTQQMWIFKAQKLVLQTGIVSGNPQTQGGTPTGAYYIVSKQRNTVLKGNNTDGSPYWSPVQYYTPFIGNVIGMHDSNWQSAGAYGVPGNQNLVGSHGCINTPPAIMPQVFMNIEVNEPVLVYQS